MKKGLIMFIRPFFRLPQKPRGRNTANLLLFGVNYDLLWFRNVLITILRFSVLNFVLYCNFSLNLSIEVLFNKKRAFLLESPLLLEFLF